MAGPAERYTQGHVKVNCQETTQARCRYTIEAHIRPELGGLPISEVNRSRVAQAANAAVRILSWLYSMAEAWKLPARSSCPVRADTRVLSRL